MKLGLVGIGDIAKKAYLPIITSLPEIELAIASRNESTRDWLKRCYPQALIVSTVTELFGHGVEALMIHAATKAHFELAKSALEYGISVYVDKPMSDKLAEVEQLFRIAKQKNLTLRTGFNRRHIPFVQDMLASGQPSTLIYQKNRSYLPAEIRQFVFDDYIHVLDSIRFLLQAEPTTIQVHGVFREGLLHSVSTQLTTDKAMALGFMNRESGKNEEKIDFIAPGIKYELTDLAELRILKDNQVQERRLDDWALLGVRRGFVPLINQFLADVSHKRGYIDWDEDSLKTHQLAEEVVMRLERQL